MGTNLRLFEQSDPDLKVHVYIKMHFFNVLRRLFGKARKLPENRTGSSNLISSFRNAAGQDASALKYVKLFLRDP
jgi:hypothetical protein